MLFLFQMLGPTPRSGAGPGQKPGAQSRFLAGRQESDHWCHHLCLAEPAVVGGQSGAGAKDPPGTNQETKHLPMAVLNTCPTSPQTAQPGVCSQALVIPPAAQPHKRILLHVSSLEKNQNSECVTPTDTYYFSANGNDNSNNKLDFPELGTSHLYSPHIWPGNV